MMIFINPTSKVNTDLPNIALAYAATHYNVRVIDLNTKPEPKDRFLNYRADIIGISIRSFNYAEAERIARLYKAKYPESKIKSISGFLDVQCCYPFVDFNDKIEYNEPFSDDYPFPRYELFDSFDIFKKNWKKGRWHYAIMTALGCPFQCTYCMSRNRKWITRSVENCIEELKHAKKKYGIVSFQIIDDCFNVSKERVLKFCKLVKPLKLRWLCTNGLRADRFDEDIAKAMKESGCMHISLGIESVDDDVLRTVKKGESSEQISNAVDIAKKYFRGVNGFFIIGLPGSSYKKDLKSVEFVKRKGINGHFSYYVPFDKSQQLNRVFYGEKAEPMSDAYPKELQKKIYEMTKHMRPGEGDFIKIAIKKIRMALSIR